MVREYEFNFIFKMWIKVITGINLDQVKFRCVRIRSKIKLIRVAGCICD
jgi:hypothetical protein